LIFDYGTDIATGIEKIVTKKIIGFDNSENYSYKTVEQSMRYDAHKEFGIWSKILINIYSPS
jgi:hypothetical protein